MATGATVAMATGATVAMATVAVWVPDLMGLC
jgi:hypothetical protein